MSKLKLVRGLTDESRAVMLERRRQIVQRFIERAEYAGAPSTSILATAEPLRYKGVPSWHMKPFLGRERKLEMKPLQPGKRARALKLCDSIAGHKRTWRVNQFLLYLLRWQMSTLVLWPVVALIASPLVAAVVANLVGGIVFYWLDKRIFDRS